MNCYLKPSLMLYSICLLQFFFSFFAYLSARAQLKRYVRVAGGNTSPAQLESIVSLMAPINAISTNYHMVTDGNANVVEYMHHSLSY
jgi:hypothetical protein